MFLEVSTSVTLNGNISDVLLKCEIIYQYVGFISVCHATASYIVSFHQISEYEENFRDLQFSVNGVTPEVFFNTRLVNKKQLQNDSQKFPRIILHLESKRNP